MPAYIPSIWKIKEPPKIHVFLWLLSKNMLMTVDNLSCRGVSKPQECQFCLEHESIHHLLFDCVVVKYVWALYNLFCLNNCAEVSGTMIRGTLIGVLKSP